MRILYLTLDPPLDPASPATGNQVRADFLMRGLEAAGLELRHAWTGGGSGALETDAAIAGRIAEERPEAILAGYWQLLERLPDDPGVPVIADCVAPRPLEQAEADPLGADRFLARYLDALERADLVLVGNRRQQMLVRGWLLGRSPAAAATPVQVLPLGCDPQTASPQASPSDPLVLVSGGRDWPWRRSGPWHRHLGAAIGDELAGRAELHLFAETDPEISGAHFHPVAPWNQWQAFLAERAHVGLELADENLERQASQSFRAMQCLAAGRPLILNDYLELAEKVERAGAGWAVDSPQAALAAVREALDPSVLSTRASGARALAAEFSARRLLPELLAWLEAPTTRRRTAAPPGGRTALHRAPERTGGKLVRHLAGPLCRQVRGRGIVVITRSDLFPADHGAAVKIVQTARGLAAAGRPVALVTADRRRWYEVVNGQLQARPLPLWLRLGAPPRALTHLALRMRGFPASNAFLYWPVLDPFYGLRAAWVGRRIGACGYLAEFPGFAQSARIARLLNGGAAVLAEHNVEYARLKEQEADLAEAQYQRLKRTELDLAAAMNAVVCVSDLDRRRLIEDGLDPVQLITIPHGVDLAAFDRVEGEDVRRVHGLDPDRAVLVFHGTFGYPPNRQALEVLATEILPRLERLGRPCQVLAIGRQPPAALDHPHIHLAGSLSALARPLKGCDVAVVPLVAGGGTRMKILDYFAAGLPVVSTTKGCEGLAVVDGRNILVRDDWDDFAAAVAGLLDDRERAATLGRAGRAFAEPLGWDAIGQRYSELFERLTRAEED